MIEYNIMSPSGKVCVDYYDYDTALKIYNENKELWKGYNKITVSNLLYVLGSICFLAGTLWNMIK